MMIAGFVADIPKWIGDSEWWAPRWMQMDDQEPRVYALNLEKSIASRRILVDDAY